MNKSMKYIFSLFLVPALSFLTSCRDQDFDFEKAYQENTLVAFANNFESIFGSIDPNQSWDFTTSAMRSFTRTDGATTEIRDSLDFGLDASNTVTKNGDLYDYITESFDNTASTTQLFFAPSGGFTIYPVSAYIGESYTLYVRVGDEDHVIFSKEPSPDMKICNKWPKKYYYLQSQYNTSYYIAGAETSTQATDIVVAEMNVTGYTYLQLMLYVPSLQKYISIDTSTGTPQVVLVEKSADAYLCTINNDGTILLKDRSDSNKSYYLYLDISDNSLKASHTITSTQTNKITLSYNNNYLNVASNGTFSMGYSTNATQMTLVSYNSNNVLYIEGSGYLYVNDSGSTPSLSITTDITKAAYYNKNSNGVVNFTNPGTNKQTYSLFYDSQLKLIPQISDIVNFKSTYDNTKYISGTGISTSLTNIVVCDIAGKGNVLYVPSSGYIYMNGTSLEFTQDSSEAYIYNYDSTNSYITLTNPSNSDQKYYLSLNGSTLQATLSIDKNQYINFQSKANSKYLLPTFSGSNITLNYSESPNYKLFLGKNANGKNILYVFDTNNNKQQYISVTTSGASANFSMTDKINDAWIFSYTVNSTSSVSVQSPDGNSTWHLYRNTYDVTNVWLMITNFDRDNYKWTTTITAGSAFYKWTKTSKSSSYTWTQNTTTTETHTNYQWNKLASNSTDKFSMPGIHIKAPEGTPIQIYLESNDTGFKSHLMTNAVKIKDNVSGTIGTSTRTGKLMTFTYTLNYDDCIVWMVSDDEKDPLVSVPVDESDGTTSSTSTLTKRYLVEDLGAVESSDIDFNDVVVDMTTKETLTYTIDATKGVINNYEASYHDQTATIRAMGGTLDFDLLVNGTTVFTKSKSYYDPSTMYNTTRGHIEYNRDMDTKEVSGWDPTTNNISVRVYNSGSTSSSEETTTKDYYNITFPLNGEVPYIIAVDPTKQWRDERHQICKDWLTGDEDAQWEWPEPHNEGDYAKWLKDPNSISVSE